MATITGLITVNGKDILEVDADPGAGGGTAAARGSLAMFDSGAAGFLYLKTGTADTAWTVVDSNASDWLLTGNTLTGTEFFGSLNDEDVVLRRNNIEQMRLIGASAALQGVLIGLNATLGGRLQISPSAAGDDIIKEIFGASNQIINVTRMFRGTTIGAASVNFDIAIPTDYVALIETKTAARQTAGAGGAVGDGASYIRTIHANNLAGVVTILKTQTDFTYEIAEGLNFSAAVSTTNVRFTGLGVATRNFTWGVHTKLLLTTT